jgi:hypothetical protein
MVLYYPDMIINVGIFPELHLSRNAAWDQVKAGKKKQGESKKPKFHQV